jgi:hypothetical protein
MLIRNKGFCGVWLQPERSKGQWSVIVNDAGSPARKEVNMRFLTPISGSHEREWYEVIGGRKDDYKWNGLLGERIL